MDIVFLTGDFSQLKHILADNLKFRGPLYNFDTAEDYIKSMQDAPPKDFKYQVIKSYEDSSSACLVYRFSKPGISTIMTQTFDTDNDKIRSILLIFDKSAFETK